jgi:phosphoenolpyruvate-protein kinase (PTS system EI component)
MAGEPDAIPLLLGLGLDEFSANGSRVPAVKQLIRTLDCAAAQDLVARALELATGAEIRALVKRVGAEHTVT